MIMKSKLEQLEKVIQLLIEKLIKAINNGLFLFALLIKQLFLFVQTGQNS